MENWKREISEVKSDYVDDGNYTSIDIFFTDDDGEAGTCVALVCMDTKKEIYLDNMFRNNKRVKAVIQEVKDGVGKTMYDKGHTAGYIKGMQEGVNMAIQELKKL